jgi:NAD(P)-dependent dehydrogenase (short-subunit alcohol dehydrogenase family)
MLDLDLRGRTAVVTGGGRGIGLAVVRACAREGMRVVAGARHVADATRTELAGSGPEAGAVTFVEVDLGHPDGPGQLVEAAGDRIDVLVNNVGSAPARTQGFLAITDEQWAATFEINLMAAVRTTRAALPVMLAGGGGSIVFTGSVNAALPDPAVLDYSAAKAALASLAKSLSKEFGARGVRVNSVAPGPVATDLWLGTGGVARTVASTTGTTPEQVAAAAAAESLTGRFSRPEEVADLIVLLAGSPTANVTGSTYTIDGGLISTL